MDLSLIVNMSDYALMFSSLSLLVDVFCTWMYQWYLVVLCCLVVVIFLWVYEYVADLKYTITWQQEEIRKGERDTTHWKNEYYVPVRILCNTNHNLRKEIAKLKDQIEVLKEQKQANRPETRSRVPKKPKPF